MTDGRYMLEVSMIDSTLHVKRENDNFAGHEILGFLVMEQEEILRQTRIQFTEDTLEENEK